MRRVYTGALLATTIGTYHPVRVMCDLIEFSTVWETSKDALGSRYHSPRFLRVVIGTLNCADTSFRPLGQVILERIRVISSSKDLI